MFVSVGLMSPLTKSPVLPGPILQLFEHCRGFFSCHGWWEEARFSAERLEQLFINGVRHPKREESTSKWLLEGGEGSFRVKQGGRGAGRGGWHGRAKMLRDGGHGKVRSCL